MVVDDVEDFRFIFRTSLEADERFDVVAVASDGREAIDLAEEARPDVIMLDVEMPGMSGLEAIPYLHRVAPTARIVMVSAFESGTIAADSLRASASSFVEKAMPLPLLLAEVERVYNLPPKKESLVSNGPP